MATLRPIQTMADLKRRKQALEHEIQRISNEMRRLKRKRPAVAPHRVSAAQQTAARALVAMQNGESITAMAFLRSKHAGADAATPEWAELEAGLREWWLHADDDTKDKHQNTGAGNPTMQKTLQQARRFLVDQELETWFQSKMSPRASTHCLHSFIGKLTA